MSHRAGNGAKKRGAQPARNRTNGANGQRASVDITQAQLF